ncbi:MAG: hypothetical protein OEP48_02630 [Betaproteobacteria bacterium]|nr:hypothetical protein [Betaproteobacteria bacterium]MDH3436179.1 hypothetical protein [Betaproteobacteria bacterium]
MRKKRFRYLITFVAAMFIANNAGASVSACIAGLGNMVAMAAAQSHPTAMGHPEHVANGDALCLTQCVQSYRDPTQELAANDLNIIPIPAFSGPCLSVRTEPTRARIAWAPKVAGPKLFILFGNLRI